MSVLRHQAVPSCDLSLLHQGVYFALSLNTLLLYSGCCESGELFTFSEPFFSAPTKLSLAYAFGCLLGNSTVWLELAGHIHPILSLLLLTFSSSTHWIHIDHKCLWSLRRLLETLNCSCFWLIEVSQVFRLHRSVSIAEVQISIIFLRMHKIRICSIMPKPEVIFILSNPVSLYHMHKIASQSEAYISP